MGGYRGGRGIGLPYGKHKWLYSIVKTPSLTEFSGSVYCTTCISEGSVFSGLFIRKFHTMGRTGTNTSHSANVTFTYMYGQFLEFFG